LRRTLGYSALILGLVFLFLSPLLKWYAVPRIEKAPLDTYQKTVNRGAGRYFSVKSISVTPVIPMQNITLAKGDPAASDHNYAVVTIFQRTTDLRSNVDIDYKNDVYKFDRSTGYSAPDAKPHRDGLTLKFPFGTKKQTYPFYDVTANKAFPARFLRTQTEHGLELYVFESDPTNVPIGTIAIPGSLAGHPDQPSITSDKHYTAQTTVYVEPVTGAIVDAGQHAVQWVTYQGAFVTTLSDTSFRNTPTSVEVVAKQIRKSKSQLLLISKSVPIFGPIIGLLLIVAGLRLLRRRRAKEPKTQAVPVTA
jgi:hypothetical protein